MNSTQPFYDLDLEAHVKNKHELWDINQIINLNSQLYIGSPKWTVHSYSRIYVWKYTANNSINGPFTLYDLYKGHLAADMSSGLIESIAATPANISDQLGFQDICPRDGQMVFADKAYCLKPAQEAMKKRGAFSAAILSLILWAASSIATIFS